MSPRVPYVVHDDKGKKKILAFESLKIDVIFRTKNVLLATHPCSIHVGDLPYLLEIGGVEAEKDVKAEDAVDEEIEVEHESFGVLLERDPPRNEENAVHDHHAHEKIPQHLPGVLRLFAESTKSYKCTYCYPTQNPNW